ncbi:IS3 family transposase [Thermoanaerobacterium sp. R66]|uniref:IS3 family transposase n=1 Tax=Thermoanaerobacterium sp. R66 TaxID=2742479 RepID=UPI00237FF523|nr:IS3 family transposase [Thermoanaerobacterium sp. R66]MDE4541329.1 IS3 family transposase [Thermoanaerobacterium sp. R66]
MSKNGIRYSEEFKQQITELYQSGQSVLELSRKYGVTTVTIYKWIKQFSLVQISDNEEITAKEYQAMKKRIAELEMENEILKKGYRHIRKKTIDEIVGFIKKFKAKYTVKLICKVLKFPRGTYYKALFEIPSKRQKEANKLKQEIRTIYFESKYRYGAPKIQKALESRGKHISLKRVQRYMSSMGLYSIVVKKFRPYYSKPSLEEKANIINRDFNASNINEKWYTDITYIYTIKDGWTYLASVMDLYSKKIIGYAYGTSMTTELAIKAVENACLNVKDAKGIILHSDLGTQYTSLKFEDYLSSKGIVHSFSRKGNPYDNACIESFHSVLKKEEINHHKYYDFNEARRAVFEYIESWYNRRRIHSAINYKTPQEVYETAL